MSSSTKVGSIIRARCPSCNQGKVTKGLFGIHRECSVCHYDFHPESGFYLGAMAVGFIAAAALTIPPVIALKFAGASIGVLVVYPLAQYAILGPLLLYYMRVLWLHLEYRMTDRLEGHGGQKRKVS